MTSSITPNSSAISLSRQPSIFLTPPTRSSLARSNTGYTSTLSSYSCSKESGAQSSAYVLEGSFTQSLSVWLAKKAGTTMSIKVKLRTTEELLITFPEKDTLLGKLMDDAKTKDNDVFTKELSVKFCELPEFLQAKFGNEVCLETSLNAVAKEIEEKSPIYKLKQFYLKLSEQVKKIDETLIIEPMLSSGCGDLGMTVDKQRDVFLDEDRSIEEVLAEFFQQETTASFTITGKGIYRENKLFCPPSEMFTKFGKLTSYWQGKLLEKFGAVCAAQKNDPAIVKFWYIVHTENLMSLVI